MADAGHRPLSSEHCRARLIEIVDRRSLLRGAGLKLASGASSSFYFDMKPTMFDPEGADLIARLILGRLAPEPVDYIGGLEMGAVPIVACVAMMSAATRPIPGFFVRKQPKDHGTQRLVEGLPAGHTLAGAAVALLEDVTTTGGSVGKAVQAVRQDGGEVRKVVTIVDREQGARDNLARQGIELVALTSVADYRL